MSYIVNVRTTFNVEETTSAGALVCGAVC